MLPIALVIVIAIFSVLIIGTATICSAFPKHSITIATLTLGYAIMALCCFSIMSNRDTNTLLFVAILTFLSLPILIATKKLGQVI